MPFPNHNNCLCHPYRGLNRFHTIAENRNRRWSLDLDPDHHLHVSTFSFQLTVNCTQIFTHNKKIHWIQCVSIWFAIFFLFPTQFYTFCCHSFACERQTQNCFILFSLCFRFSSNSYHKDAVVSYIHVDLRMHLMLIGLRTCVICLETYADESPFCYLSICSNLFVIFYLKLSVCVCASLSVCYVCLCVCTLSNIPFTQIRCSSNKQTNRCGSRYLKNELLANRTV